MHLNKVTRTKENVIENLVYELQNSRRQSTNTYPCSYYISREEIGLRTISAC